MAKDTRLRKFLNELDPDILMADGQDAAFLGVAQTPNGIIAVYSMDAVIVNLMNEDCMDYETAFEYASHNIFCAYVGERTPIFVDIIPEELLDEET